MKGLANIISILINPLILPPILLALVAAHVGAPAEEVRTVALLGFVLFFLVPVAWLFLMVRMGAAKTIEVRNRASRQGPLAVGLALMLFAATAYWFMAPVSRDPVVALTLCLALNTFLVMKITEHVKISIHVAGLAGFTAMLGTVAALDPGFGAVLPGPVLWLAWLSVPVVMWARVTAGAHVRAEVVLGLLFGLVVPPLEVLAVYALGFLRWTAVAVFLLGVGILSAPEAHAQEWGAVTGQVVAADNGFPLPGASVVVHGTNFGTASDTDGRYELRLPMGQFVLRYSAVGFVTRLDTVSVASGQVQVRNVRLMPRTVELGGVTVEAQTPLEAGVFEMTPEMIAAVPVPVRDALRALRVLPGVSATNELSNQFSVRGGGYNENLFFINGFEIFLPFRPRTGEQEGLSLVNADMADRVTLYTGGFPARYGGKLSSAVDVAYRRPQRTHDSLRASGYASLLDYGVSSYSSFLDGRLGISGSFRSAQARHFFQSQELKGAYQPRYLDAQLYAGYEFAVGHELEFLGMLASHEFELDPNGRKTFFGTLSQNEGLSPSNLQSLWVRFDADNLERDAYSTTFLGGRLFSRLTPRVRAEHSVSLYDTEETEFLDLSGTALLFQVDPGSDNPQDGDGLFPTGSSRQEDAADNRVGVRTVTGDGRWILTGLHHVAEAGWSVRQLEFEDVLKEKSVVVGRGLNGDVVRIVADSLNDATAFSAWQASAHVQDAVDLNRAEPGRLVATGGLRADYYSFTGEWTLSPRLSFTVRKSPQITWFGSVGVYFQAPTYRELRGKPEVGETILGALNRDLKSQRSDQAVLGAEYFFPTRRLYLRGEMYYKRISNLISYDVENVRVRYSGENDARGRHWGMDLQLRGELVPGLESWVNYSFLVAREEFLEAFKTPRNDGLLARPTDQRHTIALFVQDYIPSDPTWKLHMRTLFGSGLPYTPPVPGPEVGNIVTQAPGERFSARFPRFFRFDIGATKEIPPSVTGSRLSFDVTAEILNLFNMTNTVAYSWVPDASGIWQRIPTRLTPRLINVRASVRW